MTVQREAIERVDRFDRAQALTATPGHNGWTVADTSAAGTPTFLTTTDGMVLTLEATSEAQIVTMYQNDILYLPSARLKSVEFDVEVAGIEAVTTLVFGVASERNDTDDTVAEHAWFRMEGSVSTANVVVETDDGTNDNNDVATGKTLAATKFRFRIDFSRGLSDVRFYIDGDRVAAGTTFDMSSIGATQGLQPLVQLQKASGTGTPSVTISRYKEHFNYLAN